MNLYIVLIVAGLLSQMSVASIYKCEENGKLTFSQWPCDDNAKAMQLKTQKLLVNDDTETANERNLKVEHYSKTLEASRLIRLYKREITANKKNIVTLKKTLQEKLKKIKSVERHRRSVHSVQEFKRLKKVEIGLLKLKIKKKIKKSRDDIKNKQQAIKKLKVKK